MNPEKNPDAELAYGAGNVNPMKAADPGLVYDSEEVDYVARDNETLQRLNRNHSTCSQETNGTVWDLNMPSFAVSTTVPNTIMRVFRRTVTNVGSPVSAYRAVVTTPPELNIQVEPGVLSFSSLGQKASFSVTVTGTVNKDVVSASLVWDDGLHFVRSPIALYSLPN
ncbi:LOW QUALITY PROTEIN: hypothetical protein RJ639_032338, partial [Escallonia herrerae]